MSNKYNCTKCSRIFSRQIDLDRHMERKIPCDRTFTCARCYKSFNRKSNYTSHINRKILCNINKEKKTEERLLQLQLDIEKEKTQRDKIKLETEQAKIKQKELYLKTIKMKIKKKVLIKGSTINITNNTIGTQNNTFNTNIKNIDDLDPHLPTISEASGLFTIDVRTMVYNIFKHQYNSSNKQLQNNKCLKYIDGGDFIVKKDDKEQIMKYHELRDIVTSNYKNILYRINDIFGMPDRITDRDVSLYEKYLPDDVLNKFIKSENYVVDPRNNGVINKTLINAIEKL